MNNLPPGWVTARVGELCTLINGRAFKPTDWTAEGLPIIRIQNLNNPQAPFNRYSGEVDPRFHVSNGELLFAWSGTPGTSFGAHIWNGSSAILNQHIFRVLYDERLTTKEFLRLAINQKLDELIGKAHGGVGLAHVTKGKFEATEVLLPPIAEQRRIVAKIDALFARGNAAKASLERMPGMLERLRQSILAAAFRGDLTADWRARSPEVADAAELLQQIIENHRKSKSKGREEMPMADFVGDVPNGWQVAPLAILSAAEPNAMTDGPFGSNLKTTDYTSSGARVIRLGNLKPGALDLEDEAFISLEKFEDLRKHEVFAGDLVIAALAEPLARCCQIPSTLGSALVKADCIRFKPHELLNPRLLMHYLNAPQGRSTAERLGHGITRIRINMDGLRQLPVLLPPRLEQDEIVLRIENAFQHLDHVATHTKALLARSTHLDNALLAAAFRGELVPQDPNDEPASVLLDRIRAEREASQPAKRKRGTPPASPARTRASKGAP